MIVPIVGNDCADCGAGFMRTIVTVLMVLPCQKGKGCDMIESSLFFRECSHVSYSCPWVWFFVCGNKRTIAFYHDLMHLYWLLVCLSRALCFSCAPYGINQCHVEYDSIFSRDILWTIIGITLWIKNSDHLNHFFSSHEFDGRGADYPAHAIPIFSSKKGLRHD